MNKVPDPTIKRLFYYYRSLKGEQIKSNSRFICSDLLGEKIGIKSTLLRRDLSYFGQMGQKGKGYDREILKNRLKDIIGLKQQWDIVLLGAGNLGKALVKYDQFRKMGLNIIEVFDNDLDKIGRKINGYLVKNVRFLEETIKERNIEIIILAINEEDVEGVADRIKKLDIKAVWNLSPIHLDLGNDIIEIKEDLCCSLGSLIYNINS